MSRTGALCLAFFVAGTASGNDLVNCGSLDNAYGPFDYTNPSHFRDKLPVVERAHFTTEVENLQGHAKCARKGCQVAPDISYTLRAFPNHHRALMAMVRYHLEGRDKTHPMGYTPNCFFQRAIRFQPNDGTVRMIYGYYLSKTGKVKDAIDQYETAVELMPDSAEAHYNVALMYTDSEDYVLARKHARRAYELGFPLQGLRRKLERKNQWETPTDYESLKEE